MDHLLYIYIFLFFKDLNFTLVLGAQVPKNHKSELNLKD